MRKQTVMILSMIICFTILIGCVPTSKKNESGIISHVDVTIEAADEATQVIRLITADSVNSYITARMYLEQFLDYDIDSGNLDEYSELLNNTLAAFETAGDLSANLMASSEQFEEESIKVEYDVVDCAAHPDSSRVSFFSNDVNASEKSDAVKWAEDITQRFDEAPYGKGIATLASQMNTDAKTAYKQLQMAQDILVGAAYEDFADTADAAYKTAKVLKTTGTAASLVISVATCGGSTGLAAVMENGGIVMNGVNTVLEVGQLESMFIVGENGKTTLALEDIENKLAPISSAFGLYGITTASYDKYLNADLCNAFTYLAGSVYDYCQDGKIMGGTLTENRKGEIEFTLVETMLGADDEETLENVSELCKAIDIKTSVVNEASEIFEDGKGKMAHEVSVEEALSFIKGNKFNDPNSDDFDAVAFMEQLLKELEEINGEPIPTEATESSETEVIVEETDEISEETTTETTSEVTGETTEESTTETSATETTVTETSAETTSATNAVSGVPIDSVVGTYELYGIFHETEGVDYSELGPAERMSFGNIIFTAAGSGLTAYYEFEGAEYLFSYDAATGTARCTSEYGLTLEYVFDGQGHFTGTSYDGAYIYYDYDGTRIG